MGDDEVETEVTTEMSLTISKVSNAVIVGGSDYKTISGAKIQQYSGGVTFNARMGFYLK